MPNIFKFQLALLTAFTFSVLMLGPFFAPYEAQARTHESRSYNYVRTYSSDDGRSKIEINSHSSSNADTKIHTSVKSSGKTTWHYFNSSDDKSKIFKSESAPLITAPSPSVQEQIDELLETIEELKAMLATYNR